MKTNLLTVVAVCVALSGCSTPYSASMSAATFSQDATAQETGYTVQADEAAPAETVAPPSGSQNKPFFKKLQLTASMQDTDACADLLDGQVPASQACKVKFSVKGTEKLSKTRTFITNGKLSFRDLTRQIKFSGKVDDTSEYMSEYVLFANVTGTLDNGCRFTMEIGQISPYDVAFNFKVTEPGKTTPIHQYSGTADKGKLRLVRQ